MRQAKPRWHAQKCWWYVYVGGKQVRLSGKTEKTSTPPEEVWHEYHRIMAGRQDGKPAARTEDDPLVADLIGRFLDETKADPKLAPRTYEWYRRHLTAFGDYIGAKLHVSELKPHHVKAWLRSLKCGENNRNGAARAVKRCLNWATGDGHIERNPLAGFKTPDAYQPREDAYLEPADFDRFIAAVKTDAVRDIATFLQQTGCRPSEARAVEARHLDRAARCVVFSRKQSKGKRHQRIVPLSDAAFAIVCRLSAKWPDGPLFRTAAGRPWSSTSLAHEFQKVGNELGLKVFPYMLRHTFATNALTNDVDPITVATIMGHTDTTMLMRVYQKLHKKSEHIRAKLHQALGQTG